MRSDKVELDPQSPLVLAPPTSPLLHPSSPTTTTTLDTGSGIAVLSSLGVEEMFALDLTISACVISVLGFAVFGSEYTL